MDGEGTKIVTDWVLIARLAGGTPAGWIPMGGFTYGTREELQDAYDRHFARIEGQGCDYGFAEVTTTLTIAYHEPARACPGT